MNAPATWLGCMLQRIRKPKWKSWFSNGVMPLGLLRDCMEYALNDNTKLDGVLQAVKIKFKGTGGRDMLATVTRIYDLRNTRVAHQEKEVTDPKEAERHLIGWINGLKALAEA
jgi:type III restriction enzyme